MPNNYMDFIDEFKAGLQPADILTLLAGLRNTVPVYAALGATGTNEGHDEELARRWSSRAKATIDEPPNMLEPLPSQVELEQMMHRLNYPNPQVFGVLPSELSPNTLRLKAMVDAYNRQASDPYSPTTATRRRDFEEAPMRADQFMSAALKKKKKFANGGAIDFSIPDMQDGGRFIPDPQPFNKGGGVKKTLDQMMAEMAQKSVKIADKPDLARRGFLGLGKASDFPLAKMDKDMFKNAPAITEKSVTIDPGKGAAKSTLKSISETPMSRREVLQSAAGQALRGVLPDLGGLSAIGNVAKVAETAAAPTALPPSMIAPLLAQAAEQGMKLKDAMNFVRGKVPNADEIFELEETFRNYKNPSRIDYEDDLLLPSDVMRDLLAAQAKPSIMAARPEMRAMRGLAPKKYEELKDVSRDFSMQSIENALGRGVLRGEDEVEMFLRGDPKIWEIIGNR